MNAPAKLPAPSPTIRADRRDGWTPDRRRTFLESVAEGHPVEAACAYVGLSKASAYALRQRDKGFALGWSAANVRARGALADMLTSRALDGQVETWTRADGTSVTRHRHDNRLGLSLLRRLDNLVARPKGDFGYDERPDATAANSVARDFDSFLDLLDKDGRDSPALARFVDARVRQLRQLCYGQSTHETTEAEGDGVLAPSSTEAANATEATDDDIPFRWDEAAAQWRTCLAPPTGFTGEQSGTFGDRDYWRALTAVELPVVDALLILRPKPPGPD